MRLIKWMMVFAMMTALAACNEERSAEEAAEDAEQKMETTYEDAKEGTSDALDRTQEGAQELAEDTEEAAEDAQDSSAWETTKNRADRAWTATKEYSVEAWETVRESFRGDMGPEDKQRFDECVARLQRVEGLTKTQAERGCWRMMEEDTQEDYYAEKGGSDFWAKAMDATSDAWDSTKEGSRKAWTATKEYSTEAWETVRESFRGDMGPEDKQRFDECVARLQRVEGLTKTQAERGCWRMMEEDTQEDYYAEKGGSDFWAKAMDATSDAWDSTKEGSRKAWDKTKEGSKKAWAATKDYSQEAWADVKDSFRGDMTDEEKRTFDSCVKRLQKEEDLTQEQAERGCWRMMEEARQSGGEPE